MKNAEVLLQLFRVARLNEWQVRVFINLERMEHHDYFTREKDDAIVTGEMMAKRYREEYTKVVYNPSNIHYG